MSSSFNGRRPTNVSQYLANLNNVPSAQELAAHNDFHIGDDGLEFLTNVEFFDFDQFQPPEFAQGGRDAEPKGQQISVRDPRYQFNEFQVHPPPVGSSPTSLQGQYPPQPNHQLPYGGPQTGEKRKSTVASISSPADLEEQSRLAAEEDKRRRNTAASARFRVKKKQREVALEKATKEMTDKVSHLESKVQQLEMENKWLKGLITDKNDGKSLEALQKEKEAEDRSKAAHTTGVGTIDEEEDDYDDVKGEA